MHIQIEKFTGPIDVLLQLIQKEEMDIFDIDIHKITDQYLAFLKNQPLPDLNATGDFIKMAATLIYIKSRSLFPKVVQDLESEDTSDPQTALVHTLLRAQKLKNLSERLRQYSLLGRDTWTRTHANGDFLLDTAVAQSPTAEQETTPSSCMEGEETKTRDGEFQLIKPQSLLSLLKAYCRVEALRPVVQQKPSVLAEPMPLLSDCIRSLCSRLVVGLCLKMSSLINLYKSQQGLVGANPTCRVVTFLSLLELGRLGMVSLIQDKEFSDINVEVLKTIKNQDLSFVQEIELKNRELTSDSV